MKKLNKLQKILAVAACFCLVAGAVFGTLVATGAFSRGNTIPDGGQGIMSQDVGLHMLKAAVSNDAEGTEYKYFVILDLKEDREAVAETFRAVGMKATVVTSNGEEYIEVNFTREQLLAYEAPDGMLMFYTTSLDSEDDSSRRY